MPIAEGSMSAGADVQASQRPGAAQIVASIGMGLAGFVLMAGVLHASIRDPLHLHADIRSEKLAMLEQWHGKIFSAAFGTSHVHDGFDPRAFDRALAGTPAETRTANLAIEGGSQTEQFVMAQQFMKQLQAPGEVGASPAPCLVMLELSAGTNFTNEHLVHPRAINIYDLPTARLVTGFVSPTMSATQRYGRLGYAVAAMGLHYSNVGMLSNEIFTPPLSDTILATQMSDDRRGFDLMPYSAVNVTRLREIAAMVETPTAAVATPLLPGNAEMVKELSALNPHEVSFVYVVMPILSDMGHWADYPDEVRVAGAHGSLEVPIVNLARSDRYPQLFDPELWFDEGHLNGHGAWVASTLLGDELKRWYATHGGPPPCG